MSSSQFNVKNGLSVGTAGVSVIDGNGNISWERINKSGAIASDIGAIPVDATLYIDFNVVAHREFILGNGGNNYSIDPTWNSGAWHICRISNGNQAPLKVSAGYMQHGALFYIYADGHDVTLIPDTIAGETINGLTSLVIPSGETVALLSNEITNMALVVWSSYNPLVYLGSNHVLSDVEYQYLYGQLPAHTITFPTAFDSDSGWYKGTTILTKTLDTGGKGIPDYMCLMNIPAYAPNLLYIDPSTFITKDLIRIVNGSGNQTVLKFTASGYHFGSVSAALVLTNEAAILADALITNVSGQRYRAADTNLEYLYIGQGFDDYIELRVRDIDPYIDVYKQNFLNWINGQLSWDKIDKTGSLYLDLTNLDNRRGWDTNNSIIGDRNTSSGSKDVNCVHVLNHNTITNIYLDQSYMGNNQPFYISNLSGNTVTIKDVESLVTLTTLSSSDWVMAYTDGSTMTVVASSNPLLITANVPWSKINKVGAVASDIGADNAGAASGAISTHQSVYDHTKLHDRQHTITSTSDHTFPGGTNTFLRADGTFATPSGGASSYTITSDTDIYPITSPYILGSNNEDTLVLNATNNSIYIRLPFTGLTKPTTVLVKNDSNTCYLASSDNGTNSASFSSRIYTYAQTGWTGTTPTGDVNVIPFDHKGDKIEFSAGDSLGIDGDHAHHPSFISNVGIQKSGYGNSPDITSERNPRRWTLSQKEYNWIFGHLPENTRALDTVLDRGHASAQPSSIPDYLCLLTFFGNGGATVQCDIGPEWIVGDTLRLLEMDGGAFVLKTGSVKITAGVGSTTIVADYATMLASSKTGAFYVTTDSSNYYKIANGTGSDYYEFHYTLDSTPEPRWVVVQQNFLDYIGGKLSWDKIDKTGAVASDVGAIALDSTQFVDYSDPVQRDFILGWNQNHTIVPGWNNGRNYVTRISNGNLAPVKISAMYMPTGAVFYVFADGQNLTLTPDAGNSETINGLTSLVLSANNVAALVSDGSNDIKIVWCTIPSLNYLYGVYNNTSSGLVATTLQGAIDELNVNASYLGFASYTAPTLTGLYFNLPSVVVRFGAGGTYADGVEEYTMSASTGALAVIDNSVNFICAYYNGGNPIWAVKTTLAEVDFQQYIPFARVYKRAGSSFLHTQEFFEPFTCIPDRLVQRFVATSEYGRESGLLLTADAGNYFVSQGYVWIGADRINVAVIDASTNDGFFDCMYSGASTGAFNAGTTYRKGQKVTQSGTDYVSLVDGNVGHTPPNSTYWTTSIEGNWAVPKSNSGGDPLVDNAHYMDEVSGGLQPLTTNYYTINYIYRGIEAETHTYRVLGTSQFATLAEAQASSKLSSLPQLITSHAMLIGRVIVQQGTTTGYTVESAFETRFTSTASISQHNNLSDIQGGTPGQYYHLTSAQVTNVGNLNSAAYQPTTAFESANTNIQTHISASAPHSGHLTSAHIDTDNSATSLHHTLGTDASQAASGNHVHGNISNIGAVGSIANLPLITGTSGVLITSTFGSSSNTFCQGNDSRLSDARTPTSHTHGNISNTGTIGTTATLPIITGTSGILQAGSFGTTSGTFCQGNDSRLSDTRNTTNTITFNTTGGAAAGTTFNGSVARIVDYSTIGAAPASSVSFPGFGTTGTTACAGNDSRLSDSRTPNAHNQAESTITFTDITTGNASIISHGYLPKLSNNSAQFLNGTGTFSTPTAAVSLDIQHDGVSLSTSPTLINFTGGGVDITEPIADQLTITVPGGGGGFSFKYLFNTTISSTPATSNIQYNNTTPASVTELYLNETDVSGTAIDIYADELDVGDWIMVANADKSKYHIYTVASQFISINGVDTIPVIYQLGTVAFNNGEVVYFSRATAEFRYRIGRIIGILTPSIIY